jgi:hypothetical protein
VGAAGATVTTNITALAAAWTADAAGSSGAASASAGSAPAVSTSAGTPGHALADRQARAACAASVRVVTCYCIAAVAAFGLG